jgi:hypothetical protein
MSLPTVNSGSYCAPLGALGQTVNGTCMRCRENPQAPTAAGQRARWRREGPAPVRASRPKTRRKGLRRSELAFVPSMPELPLPDKLVERMDDGELDVLRCAAGQIDKTAGVKVQQRKTDKLKEFGLLDEHGNITTRGKATLLRSNALTPASAANEPPPPPKPGRTVGDVAEWRDGDETVRGTVIKTGKTYADVRWADNRIERIRFRKPDNVSFSSWPTAEGWEQYDNCPTCYAPAGTACRDLRFNNVVVRMTSHDGRPRKDTAADHPADPASADDYDRAPTPGEVDAHRGQCGSTEFSGRHAFVDDPVMAARRDWETCGRAATDEIHTIHPPVITDRYGRVWSRYPGSDDDMYQHDSMVFPADQIHGLEMPSPANGNDPSRAKEFCSICRSQWPARPAFGPIEAATVGAAIETAKSRDDARRPLPEPTMDPDAAFQASREQLPKDVPDETLAAALRHPPSYRGGPGSRLAAGERYEGEFEGTRERLAREAVRREYPADPNVTPVSGIRSTEPLMENTWGGVPEKGKLHYHGSGTTGRWLDGMGRDRFMDIDGQPLANRAGQIAHRVTSGEITPQRGFEEMAALRDRTPPGTAARQNMDHLVSEMGAPAIPPPPVPAGTPAPIARLITDLHNDFPVVRATGRETGRLLDVVHRWHAGDREVGSLRLVSAVRDAALNVRHESDCDRGKSAIDHRVQQALAELEQLRRTDRKALYPPSLSGDQ